MKVLLIGASGAIGKRIAEKLSGKHEVITAGRNSGDERVDIAVKSSIEKLFKKMRFLDACICTAALGAVDHFQSLTDDELLANMKGKLFGQINTVLIGQQYLNNKGSFTLTSGIFADKPAVGVTGGGVISGAIHSFVLSAAIELQRGMRINAVSPGMAEDSAEEFGHLFPHLKPVPMEKILLGYLKSLEGTVTGEIFRIYS